MSGSAARQQEPVDGEGSHLLRRYTLKLRPTGPQARALDRHRRIHCDLWNACLEDRNRHWRGQYATGNGRKPRSFFDQGKEIAAIRELVPGADEIGATCLAQTMRRLEKAFLRYRKAERDGTVAEIMSRPGRKRRRDGQRPLYPKFQSASEYSGFSCLNALRKGKRVWNGWRWNPSENWRHGTVSIMGIPGAIKVRGKIPRAPLAIICADFIWRAEQWWMSLVVELPPRMTHGTGICDVKFDLLDEFAAVKIAADGPSGAASEAGLSPAEDGISPHPQQLEPGVVPATPETGVDRRPHCGAFNQATVPATPETGVDRRASASSSVSFRVPATPETGVDRRDPYTSKRSEVVPATPETETDRRNFDENAGSFIAPATPETGADRRTETKELVTDGAPATPELAREGDLQRRMSRCKRNSKRYRRLRKLKARREARAARQRREAHHRWTTALVRAAGAITVTSPDLLAVTASGRGDERQWGAAVATKAEINRHVLGQAPGIAIQMLQYKAAEAGIRCVVAQDEAPKIAVGGDLVSAGKLLRKARRKMKELS